jgi:K+-sensing histidine kinase KdpD
LFVYDAVAGVPPQRRPGLFQSWQSGEEEAGSVGLGLWIVRLLSEAQGGHVAYVRADEESRFEVTLPRGGEGQESP